VFFNSSIAINMNGIGIRDTLEAKEYDPLNMILVSRYCN